MQSKIISALVFAVAVTASPAVICPQVVPTCDNVPCNKMQKCEIFPQTATSCARAECVPFFQSEPVESIICPQVLPTCDNVPCNKLSKCEVFPQTETTCARAACVPFFNEPTCTLQQTKFDKECCLSHAHDWTCSWNDAEGQCNCTSWD
ncbi:hypothetical protein HDU92_006690 [Lobulomyces angularis]|nr:hypothetical protein HDU92_006690 [Lobulomyces angularis]